MAEYVQLLGIDYCLVAFAWYGATWAGGAHGLASGRRRGGKQTMSWWDIGADLAVLLGGLGVLVGSVAQAWGDLGKYQYVLHDDADADPGPPAGVNPEPEKTSEGPRPKGAVNDFLSKTIFGALCGGGVRPGLAPAAASETGTLQGAA
jgi:hypothetical protein